MNRLIALMLLLLPLIQACDQGPPADRLRTGTAFPPLVLTGLDGQQVALDSFRGRVVVLNLWATWCAPCRKELPGLERLHQQLDPQRFAVIGLSVDSDLHVAREYLTELGISFANYIDRDRHIAGNVLGVRVYPDTFVLSRNGALLLKVSGEREWDAPGMVRMLEAAYNGESGLSDLI